jgi:L-aminopeptidase/D-esterase-like protein
VKNLITDVPGVTVGSAHDARAATGVTVAIFRQELRGRRFGGRGGVSG